MDSTSAKPQANVVSVEFHGQKIVAINSSGEIRVALKPICENIGLQWEAQLKRIKRSDVIASTMSMMDMVAEDGRLREVVTLPLEMLNGWLLGVEVNRVKPELREKLVEYQRECFSVLWKYFSQGEAVNQNFRAEKTRKALPNGLSIEQQDAIKQLVKARAEALPEEKRAGATIKLWSSIKSKFRVGYKELPPENFTEALSLVARLPLEGELVEEAAPPMLQRFVISRREASNLHCLFTHVRSISGFINQVVPMLRMAESPLAGRYQGIFSDLNFAADLLGDLRDRCKAEYQATMVAM